METVFKLLGAALAVIIPVGGFLFWHFKTINSFKDELHRVEKEFIHLKNKDENQQEVIDQLKNFLPILIEITKQKIKK